MWFSFAYFTNLIIILEVIYNNKRLFCNSALQDFAHETSMCITKGFKIITSVESSLVAQVSEIPFVVFWFLSYYVINVKL